MTYRILVLPQADLDLRSLPEADAQRVDAAIRRLSSDPRPSGCKKLKDNSAYRIRVGSFRVLYLVDDSQKSVLVAKVGHRREVYR